MTTTQSLNIYKIALRYFKNEVDAASFIKEMEVVVDNKFDAKNDTLSTKEDLIKSEVSIRKEISDTKVDLIKWVFAFFVTLALLIIGLYLKK